MNHPTLKIALLQDMDRGGIENAAAHTEQLIRQAASNGAKIICTQELFLTEYFCWKQESDFFNLARPIPSDITDRFSKLAAELEVVLILSLFERRAPGLCHNTSVVIDADGSLMGKYRKMHIPQDPGFEEKFFFAPGDLGFRSFQTKFRFDRRHHLLGSVVPGSRTPDGALRRKHHLLSDRHRGNRHRTRIADRASA